MVLIRIGSHSSGNRGSELSGLLVPCTTKRVLVATIAVVALLFVSTLHNLDQLFNAQRGYTTSTTDVVTTEVSTDTLTDDLISWLRSNGAVIDERISIRRVDPAEPTSVRGIFADGAFEGGEQIFTIPTGLIHDGVPRQIKNNAGKTWKDGHSDCGTTYEIHDAMVNGTNPYGRYLEQQPRRYVPGYWSSDSRELLGTVLGKNLPPQTATQDSVRSDWLDYCQGATADELEVHASQLVVARGDGRLMVPFYDMINHRNGHWYNAQHHSRQQGFSLVTNRKVEAGEQLYCSYNTCTICGSRVDNWGTPEMLRDYGFVEPFPQRYVLDAARLKFGVDEKEDGGGLVVKWYVPPSRKGLDFLAMELERLRGVDATKESAKWKAEGKREIPKPEWNTIWMFHEAMLVAFTAALEQAPNVSDEVWSMKGDEWRKDRSGDRPPNRFY